MASEEENVNKHGILRLLFSIWPYRVVRWFVAGLFLYASLVKLPHLHHFVETIVEFGIIPETAVFATALAIIGLELISGVGLLFDLRGALGTITCLLITFMGVLWYGVAKNLDIDCGCFGPGQRNAGLHHALATDACLLVACGYLYCSRWFRRTSNRSASSASKPRGTGW